MMFGRIDFDDQKILEIPLNLHKYTWDYYFKQYAVVLNYIISLSFKKDYLINRKQMAVMFIYRHIVELFLKSKIANEGQLVPNTHSLTLLTQELKGQLSQRFLDSLSILKPEGEGDNFRYIKSEDGNRHYNGELLDVLSSLSLFVESDEIKNTGLFTCQLNINDKKLKHEWTLYTIETQTLGHIKTQYDDLIITLLHEIKSIELNTYDIYLPLLFLIRHSLELGYKDNIAEVQTKLTNSQIKKATQSHSLVSLNNIIEQFVVETRSTMTAKDDSIKNEIDRYLPIVKNLSNNLHAIDNASRSFRFPIDRDGNTIKIPLSKRILSESVDAFQKADSFISLSLSLLSFYGLNK
jgi:HEPN domain-containing protein